MQKKEVATVLVHLTHLLTLKMEKPKPIFNKRIFWDTDFNKLEYDKNYKSIITRVFDRGDIEDIRGVQVASPILKNAGSAKLDRGNRHT